MKQGKFILILFVIVMLLAACTPTPTIEKVKVTFIGLDGSEISNKEVGKGTTITPPTLESTEENIFYGWSLTKDGKELFDSSTLITSDTTLYSVWLKINVHNLRIRVHGQTGYVPIYFEFISLYYKELLT